MQHSKRNNNSRQSNRKQSVQPVRKRPTRQQKAEGMKIKDLNRQAKNPFGEKLAELIKAAGKKYLSNFSYSESADVVNNAIKEYLKEQRVPGKHLKLVKSTPAEGWRGDCTLMVSGRGATIKYEIPKEMIKLEQLSESAQILFDAIINQLSKAHLVSLQNAVTAVTLRTLSNATYAVIFQVKDASRKVIQNLKSIDQFLERESDVFSCSYALITGSGNACNLENPLPLGYSFKKISGGDTISVGSAKLAIHPLEQYRTNRAVLHEMDKKVIEMLSPEKEEHLIDLYAGSSHWTYLVGDKYTKTWSVDIKKSSRESFNTNSTIRKKKNGSFTVEKITSEFLKRFIPDNQETPTTVIIDPPASQLQAGILRTIADKKVQKIVHIFNDMNVLPEEIRKWRKHGYILKKILPFDSKPYSGQPECIVLLTIDFLGLLDKTKELKKKQIKTTPAANTSGIRFVQD